MKLEPIIAVANVKASAEWYQCLLGLDRTHGGDEFDVLRDADGNVVLCLHAWGIDEHPTMIDSGTPVGNGLILYFRVSNLDTIRDRARELDWSVEEELHQNPNSRRTEFSLLDPDGYYLTITESHDFGR